MVIPAGFYPCDTDHFLALLPPEFCADRPPDLDEEVGLTNPLGQTRIRIACGLSPTDRQYVVVLQPTDWFAESGFATLPGPLLASAWASNLRRDILATPSDAQAIVRRYGLPLYEWKAYTSTRTVSTAA